MLELPIGVKIELLYSETGTTKKPSGMQPVGLFPDLIRGSHAGGLTITFPINRSSAKARRLMIELFETFLTSKDFPS